MAVGETPDGCRQSNPQSIFKDDTIWGPSSGAFGFHVMAARQRPIMQDQLVTLQVIDDPWSVLGINPAMSRIRAHQGGQVADFNMNSHLHNNEVKIVMSKVCGTNLLAWSCPLGRIGTSWGSFA